jgi:hypothetical protein
MEKFINALFILPKKQKTHPPVGGQVVIAFSFKSNIIRD